MIGKTPAAHFRNGVLFLIGLWLSFGNAAMVLAEENPLSLQRRPLYVAGEILVALKLGKTFSALARSGQEMAMEKRAFGRTTTGSSMVRVKLREGTSVEAALAGYRADPAVAAVSPNYYRYPQFFPNDTFLNSAPNLMWGMHDTGQDLSGEGVSYATNSSDPTADNDVDAPEAWDVTTGSANVVVAVIDSGVDYTHPELSGAMWDATAATFEGAAQGSANHGWDFANGDDDPYPVANNHGSHVAGTIAASGDNGLGVPGMAYGVTIMALKVFTDLGNKATDAEIIQAINYARENGAHIINLSLGGESPENTLVTMAVSDAVDAGLLLVIAAGNGGSDGVGGDNDTIDFYPANYAGNAAVNGGVITVMATDQADARASFSNYGVTNVTIGAPGVNIISTITGRAVVQQENGAGLANDSFSGCEVAGVANGMAGTIFNNGSDCTGPGLHRWGWWKFASGFFSIRGDLYAPVGEYELNADSTIRTPQIDTSGASSVILRYTAYWDMECDYDGVYVDIYNGAAFQTTLGANDLNVNESQTSLCANTPGFTHSGRSYDIFGSVEFSHDITAYSAANLNVRFRFFSDGFVNSSDIVGGYHMFDIFLDTDTSDYSTAYDFFNGTSMASPMVAGIAALVKSQNPATPERISRKRSYRAAIRWADTLPW